MKGLDLTKHYIGSCGYDGVLKLTLSDGSQVTVFKGTDDCGSLAFGSYSGYFIPQEENAAFWEIFGLPNSAEERCALAG